MAGFVGMAGGTAEDMRAVARAGGLLEAAGLAKKGSASDALNQKITPRAGAAYGPARTEPVVPNTRTPYDVDAQGLKWTQPQTLGERVALQSAISGEGEVVMKGPFGDPRYQDPGWVKMQLLTYSSDGNKIEIHYMRNTITGRTDQFKFVSRGEYPKPKGGGLDKVSPGDRPGK